MCRIRDLPEVTGSWEPGSSVKVGVLPGAEV